MRRTGFTLLELAVVLTLLVALAALALPAVRSLTGAVLLDEAAERVRAELLIARAEAQREGLPVRVWAERVENGGWRVLSRRLSVSEDVVTLDAGSLLLPEPRAGAAAGNPADPSLAGRVLVTLPSGVRIALPEAGMEMGMGVGSVAGADDALPLPFADEEPTPEEPEERRLELAVFLPDGSAMESRSLDVVDPDGERRRLVISRWSGLARVERVGPPGGEAEAEGWARAGEAVGAPASGVSEPDRGAQR